MRTQVESNKDFQTNTYDLSHDDINGVGLNRRLYLTGEICEENVVELVKDITAINQEQQVINQQTPALCQFYGLPMPDEIEVEPIVLEINSPGGYLSYGFQLISAIQRSQVPVIAYVSGGAMSMAVSVVAACDYAVGTEYSRFMIHDVSGGYIGKSNDMDSTLANLKSGRALVVKVLTQYTNLTEEQVIAMLDANHDVYFDAKEALEYGIIDEIHAINVGNTEQKENTDMQENNRQLELIGGDEMGNNDYDFTKELARLFEKHGVEQEYEEYAEQAMEENKTELNDFDVAQIYLANQYGVTLDSFKINDGKWVVNDEQTDIKANANTEPTLVTRRRAVAKENENTIAELKEEVALLNEELNKLKGL